MLYFFLTNVCLVTHALTRHSPLIENACVLGLVDSGNYTVFHKKVSICKEWKIYETVTGTVLIDNLSF